MYQPDTLLKLYQEHNPGANISGEDIFNDSGFYITNNKWNNSTSTGTIMHLCVGMNVYFVE